MVYRLTSTAIGRRMGRAAWALNKEREVGTIRPGCSADFVLLEADPLKDIRNLRRISAVYLGGVPVDRERIRARIRDMKPPSH